MTTSIDEIELIKLVRPMPQSAYEVDHFVHNIESTLNSYADDYGLELDPDYQRGHVWTQEQQELFMEALIRGAISTAGLVIQFNCASFSGKNRMSGDLPPHMQCVDGLQRLTAMRRYVSGEINAFGINRSALQGTEFDIRNFRFKISIHEFQNRCDLLQYYLDLNAGGTPHSKEEIERIRGLHLASKSIEKSKQLKIIM